ncbi:nucleotidyltransferase family protein [Candidatus Collierbacteria bacterium]|nr:nucleotidyltransferase family protein [Candidatus Collierbacteria bacterium]
MKQTIKTIQTQIKHKLPVLAHDYQVKRLGIFGSVARGKDTAKSDVDILVSFFRPPGLFDFVRLEDYLSSLLKRKVDLVTRKAIKPVIRDRVLREVTYV